LFQNRNTSHFHFQLGYRSEENPANIPLHVCNVLLLSLYQILSLAAVGVALQRYLRRDQDLPQYHISLSSASRLTSLKQL